MNIEETIEILKQEPNFSLNYYNRENAIDVLLTAYEKQSKEIEELKENMRKRITYCNELEKDLFENCTNYVVSKDKIKAKIEELQEDIKYSANPLSIDNSKFGIKVLQSLLEKEGE